MENRYSFKKFTLKYWDLVPFPTCGGQVFSPPPLCSPTPAGVLQFNSDTGLGRQHQNLLVEGSVLRDCPPLQMPVPSRGILDF